MLKRVLMVFPPLVLAALVILFMRGIIPNPFGGEGVNESAVFTRDFDREQVTAVYYRAVEPQLVKPKVSGYGRIVASQTWQAVSQVSGRVLRLYDNLGVGSRLAAGTEVIVIDDEDYVIGAERAQATLASVEAELEELAITEQNLKQSLGVERRIEQLDLEELSRKRQLIKGGSASQTQLDAANRSLILQQKRILDLENNLSVIPSKIKRLQSNLIARRLDVEEAKRTLDNTRITVPFDSWVSDLNVQKDQFVKNGEVLSVFKSLGSPEVIAEINPQDIGHLLLTLVGSDEDQSSMASQSELLNLLRSGDIRVDVVQSFGDQHFARAGEIVRLNGAIDQTTGTLGLVVRIGELRQQSQQNKAPPLVEGVLVEVVFHTLPKEKQFVVPNQAVHYNDLGEAYLYTISDDDRLISTPVVLGLQIDEQRIIREGLKDGDKVIVSNLPFVAERMRLNPIPAVSEPL